MNGSGGEFRRGHFRRCWLPEPSCKSHWLSALSDCSVRTQTGPDNHQNWLIKLCGYKSNGRVLYKRRVSIEYTRTIPYTDLQESCDLRNKESRHVSKYFKRNNLKVLAQKLGDALPYMPAKFIQIRLNLNKKVLFAEYLRASAAI
jgi:hypothetical protein